MVVLAPVSHRSSSKAQGDQSHFNDLQHAIDHAAHLLPAQGPITVFIHHNTLHAFEDSPFLEGVKAGAKVFGCHPFLTEERYRDALRRGRIRVGELEAVVRENLGFKADEKILRNSSRLDLWLAMLEYPLRSGPTDELLWFVAETDALRRFRSDASAATSGKMIAETRRWVMRDLRGGNETARNNFAAAKDPEASRTLHAIFERFGESAIETWSEQTWEAFTLQALWRVCCAGVAKAPVQAMPPEPTIRHRDLIEKASGFDCDPRVNELLIRFSAAFLDQGFSNWPLPKREEGFFRSFCELYRKHLGPPDHWLGRLAEELIRLETDDITPLESIEESLEALGVTKGEWRDFLSATLLALRGWGGMIKQVEERGDRVAHPIPSGSVVEFLAIRLILDRLSVADAARSALGLRGELHAVREAATERIRSDYSPPSVEQRAFSVFQLAQVLGWSPDELYALSETEWAGLILEINAFNTVERRQVFHLAYERRFATQTLDAFALHAANAFKPTKARFQVITCLDEREESFRRHLEEIAPYVETFGAAGFFAVAMYYQARADAHFVPLCPIVIRPQHWVREEADVKAETLHRRRARMRKASRRGFIAVSHSQPNVCLGSAHCRLLGRSCKFPADCANSVPAIHR